MEQSPTPRAAPLSWWGRLRANATGPTALSALDAATEWRAALTVVTCGTLLYLALSGMVLWLLPFSVFTQLSLLVHTLAGIVILVPMSWYLWRHWLVRRRGNLSHYQLLGYVALVFLVVCVASGLVVTWQGVDGPRMDEGWRLTHLVSGLALAVVLVLHLATVLVRKATSAATQAALQSARRWFFVGSSVLTVLLFAATLVWSSVYTEPELRQDFPADYDWHFGKERPFAPSLARITPDANAADHAPLGAINPRVLAGSERCGTCHEEIYKEWLPGAHRYSSMDTMFQEVQEIMAKETSPEHTRYCAGCHDPISLFAGAKTSSNVTLSAEGWHEGISCLSCHSIVQADVQGNADYTIEPPRRYVYELNNAPTAELISDFLVRTYPDHHIRSYSRPLYKTTEFCGGCHKQYMDKDINTDIGRVQGQNQYDSWRQSRWHTEGDARKTTSCRECHMPLVPSHDPAAGDLTDYNRNAHDAKHRSHRFLGANQYIPTHHKLPGGDEHVRLTEAWMRGEIEIPEIADKWTSGPVVRMDFAAPASVRSGEEFTFQLMLTNNKGGHDFPTGPLDMIESWIELTVKDDAGKVLHHTGGRDARGVVVEPVAWFKADGFDRKREFIDRHNLWDLVGKSYARSLYPGRTDTAKVPLQCPSMAADKVGPAGTEPQKDGGHMASYTLPAGASTIGNLNIEAVLWYRKANPAFLDRVYGAEAAVRTPLTEVNRVTTRIAVLPAEVDSHR